MKRFLALILLGLSVFVLASCGSDDKTNAPVLSYELNEEVVASVDAVMQKYMDLEYFPGAQVVATKNGKIIFEKAYGYQEKYDMGDVIENPIVNTMDTLYDLASVTKVVATTQSIMKLVYEGKLSVSDKVVKYIPEFGVNGKEDITISELLTHTSGLPQWKAMFLYTGGDRAKVLDIINNSELMFKRGELKYSDLGFQLLAFIVEKITGMGMDEYVEKEIYKPLGMNSTVYTPLKKGFEKNQIAATSWGNPYELAMVDEEAYPGFGYDCTEDLEAFKAFTGWRNYTLEGEVNDGNAGMAGGGIAGHAGVYSNAKDLAILGQLMLNGGSYGNVKLYDEKTIDLFRINHTATEKRGYGFELIKSYMGDLATLDTFGHNGFTGTHVTYNRTENMQIIILTNKQNVGLRTDVENPAYYSTFAFGKEVANALSDLIYTSKKAK